MSKKSKKRSQKLARAAAGFKTSESESQGSTKSESEGVNPKTPASDTSGEVDDSPVKGQGVLGGGVENLLNSGFYHEVSNESNEDKDIISTDVEGSGTQFWVSDLVKMKGTAEDSVSVPEESPKQNGQVDTPKPGGQRRNSKTHKEIPTIPPIDEFNLVSPDECPHMLKSMSLAGLRKAFKGDVKPFCSPCSYTTPKSKVEKKWVCLQCGHISCGDPNAQNGDAMKHFKTPRNNLHAIVVELGDEYRCWCFLCQSEVNSKNAKVKDGVVLVKKTVKGKLSSSLSEQKKKEEDEIAGRGIALPAPPPLPPAPPIQRQYSGNGKKKGVGKVDQSNSENDNNRPLGLENLGNTCFMNATLQCLSRTKLLLPKLDLFGSGQNISVLVTPTEDQAKITVLNNLAEHGLENGEVIPEIQEGDGGKIELKTPFLINLNISSESMTARLKNTFNAITRRQDVHAAGDTSTTKSTISRPSGRFRPSGVHSMISKNFRPGHQHDSHELLRTVVDMMKKDQTKAFRAAIMKKFGVAKGGEASDPKMVELVKSLDQKTKHQTFVDEIFGGELMTTQTCLICKSVRRFHEDFLDLSLPVIGANINQNNNQKNSPRNNSESENAVTNHTVEECLIAFTAPELLTGSNVVECETCHGINLEKIENGAAFEDVFPSPIVTPAASTNKVKDTEADKKDGGNKRHDERKKRRPSRQSRRQAQVAAASATAQNESNHFTEDSLVTRPRSESQCSSKDEDTQKSKNQVKLTPKTDNFDEIPPTVSDSETEQSQDLFDSVEATLPLPDNDLDADSDLPSALDGIGGNTSDCEGSSNENDVTSTIPGLDLPLYDKFHFFQAPEVTVDTCTVEMMDVEPTAADEGYSEGENSGENESGGTRNDVTMTLETEKPKPPPVTKCPCSRQQFISRPPEFLTIHLKRFQVSGRGTSKLNHHIAFPLLLDLTRFCSESPQIFDEDGRVLYKLYGFVEHSGNIHWGHYVAYVKVQGQGKGKDNWYYASDTHVNHCTESQIPSKDPYILFYERVRKRTGGDVQNGDDFQNGGEGSTDDKLETEVGRLSEEIVEFSLENDNQNGNDEVLIVISPPEEEMDGVVDVDVDIDAI